MPSADNFDPAETRKFEKLASRWWDPDGEFRTLHQINPLRIDFINRCAPLDGCRVLDVGCGGGLMTEAMARLGARVSGIDMGEALIEVAQLHLLESNLDIHYEVTPIESLADNSPETFDIVTCMEMLEHVPNPESIVEACSRLVKPGGHLFFSTINRNLKSGLLAIVGAEYLLGMLPRGTHDYDKLIRPSELQRWCRAAQLDTRQMTGVAYNPLTRHFHLSPDVQVNYMIHCTRPGAQGNRR